MKMKKLLTGSKKKHQLFIIQEEEKVQTKLKRKQETKEEQKDNEKNIPHGWK